MATYYVWSGAGGANNGTSWTDAYTSFASAVNAASSSGDVIKVHKAHAGIITATTTYTFAADVSVIVVDKDNSDALAVMDGTTGYLGNTTTSYYLTFAGGYKVYFYGICARSGGTGNVYLQFTGTDNGHFELDNCYLYWGTTGNNSLILFGGEGATISSYTKLIDTDLRFGHINQSIEARSKLEITGGSIISAGSAPSTLFKQSTAQSDTVKLNGVDLSHITGTLIGSHSLKSREYVFENCVLSETVTVLASQTPSNLGSASSILYNCSSGDEHYHIAHYDAFGETIVSTGIYANDGAEWNLSSDKYSWKITTTAYCSYYTPYVTPWIRQYHDGTSAIIPYLECLRDNSSGAVFQNDEVWGEFSYQGTSGYTLGTVVNDRMALLGSPADQTASSKGASDWTGETGTAGYFKLNPTATITPAEIGNLSARVCVGEPSISVYVDPQIRT